MTQVWHVQYGFRPLVDVQAKVVGKMIIAIVTPGGAVVNEVVARFYYYLKEFIHVGGSCIL